MAKTVQQKIDDGREYREMMLTVVVDEEENNDEEHQEEEKRKIVEGYATTFDEEYDLYWLDEKTLVREKVLKSAFDETDLTDVIMQYDHEGRVFARLSNGTMQLNVDDKGLKVIADLGGTEIGRQLYEEIEKGYTNKMSFGFIVSGDEITEQKVDDIQIYLRTITKIEKVFDVSAVSLPANNYTSISARKHCDGLIAEFRAECLFQAEKRKQKALKIKQLQARMNLIRKEQNNGN